MGKYDRILPVGLLGVLGIGGVYLLTTGHGTRLLHGIGAQIGGYDDPFAFFEDNQDAWDPTSKTYKDIQKRIWEKKKENKKKDMQLRMMESYFNYAYQ